MISIRLDSDTDSISLSDVEIHGSGWQVLAGVTGLGLPPVQGQWQSGAGDGAVFRGQRVLPRDIDLPLYVLAQSRDELTAYTERLTKMFARDCTLTWVEDRETEWYVDVRRTGGGDWVYGIDTTGDYDAMTSVTLRAGDPFWKRRFDEVATVTADAPRGLLVGSLTELKVAASQAFGTILLRNTWGADAYPTWQLFGPGHDFEAISPSGEELRWQGTLSAGETLTISCKPGAISVVDGTGADRFDELAPAPRFWRVPSGTSEATASMLGTTPGQSKILCSWQPRRWAVI